MIFLALALLTVQPHHVHHRHRIARPVWPPVGTKLYRQAETWEARYKHLADRLANYSTLSDPEKNQVGNELRGLDSQAKGRPEREELMAVIRRREKLIPDPTRAPGAAGG